MSGFDYGNTRLRAMKSRLFDRTGYHLLAEARTIDSLLAALTGSPYQPDIEAALPRYRGLRRLDEALRLNLARTLRSIRDFYEESLRTGIDLLLGRWDLHNVRAILRGKARVAPAEDIVPFLVPAGRLDETTLRELVQQPGVRATLDLMGTWSIPSRRMAQAVLAVWPRYESTGDPVELEDALNRAYAAHVDKSLAGADPELDKVLRREIDQINVLTSLRLREAAIAGEQGPEPIPESFLAGGRMSGETLAAAALEADRERVSAMFNGDRLPFRWREPILAWVQNDDLIELGETLDRVSFEESVGLFSVGDPLGFAIPIAYMRAKEEEVRNLRRIGRGVEVGATPETIEDLLVVMP